MREAIKVIIQSEIKTLMAERDRKQIELECLMKEISRLDVMSYKVDGEFDQNKIGEDYYSESVMDARIGLYFMNLCKYPKIETHCVVDDGVSYKVDQFKSGPCDSILDAVGEVKQYVDAVIANSSKIWIRIFPELTEHSGKYYIRVRMASDWVRGDAE